MRRLIWLAAAALAWGLSAAPAAAQCSVNAPAAADSHPVTRTPRLGLQFFQNGAPVEMRLANDDSTHLTVTLRRAPFEIRAPHAAWSEARRDEGLAIAVDDEVCFADKLRIRQSIEETPFFGRYRAMADHEFGAGRLISARGRGDDYGYNYIVGGRFNASGTDYHGLFVSRIDRRYSDTEDLMQSDHPVTMVFYLDRALGRPPTVQDQYGVHDVIDPLETEIVTVNFID